MLNFLRQRSVQKYIYIGIAIFVIPGFVIFGVVVGDEGNAMDKPLGVISGKKITLKDYLSSYEASKRQIYLRYGDMAKELAPYLKQEAWNRLLLLEYAKKNRIKVSDQEVVGWLAAQPVFANEGRFNAEFYKLFVTQQLRITLKTFEEEIRQMLTINKIRDHIAKNSDLKDEELKQAYAKERAERDLSYITLPSKRFESEVQISEDEIKEIYPILKDQLKAPSEVKIKYLFVDKAVAAATPALLANAEATMEELSKEYNLPILETPFFTRGAAIPGIGMEQAILDFGFTSPTGIESDWMETTAGYYRIVVTEKGADKTPSIEEAYNDLRDILTNQRSRQTAMKKAEDLRLKLTPPTFAATAAQEGLEVRHSQKWRADTFLPGMGPSENFAAAIFSVEEGKISEVIATPEGAALVLITKLWPVEDAKFEADKEDFKRSFTTRNLTEEFQKLLASLQREATLNHALLNDILE